MIIGSSSPWPRERPCRGRRTSCGRRSCRRRGRSSHSVHFWGSSLERRLVYAMMSSKSFPLPVLNEVADAFQSHAAGSGRVSVFGFWSLLTADQPGYGVRAPFGGARLYGPLGFRCRRRHRPSAAGLRDQCSEHPRVGAASPRDAPGGDRLEPAEPVREVPHGRQFFSAVRVFSSFACHGPGLSRRPLTSRVSVARVVHVCRAFAPGSLAWRSASGRRREPSCSLGRRLPPGIARRGVRVDRVGHATPGPDEIGPGSREPGCCPVWSVILLSHAPRQWGRRDGHPVGHRAGPEPGRGPTPSAEQPPANDSDDSVTRVPPWPE